MANINKNNSYMEFPLQIKRQYAGPIEFTEIWYDLEEAKTYAKSGATSYAGQTIKVVDERLNKVTTYTIQIDGSLKTVGEEKHTHTVDEVTETAEKKYVTPADKTRWDDKYTKEETNTHIKTAKDEVIQKINELENGRVWKPSVETFADIAKTYPTPQDTWCVITKDTNIIWMYEASKQEWIDLGHSVIHENATQSKDGLMSKEDKKKLDGIDEVINTAKNEINKKITDLDTAYKAEDKKINDRIDGVIAKTTTTTDEEVEELLTPEIVKEILEMASEQDIRLLFDGTSLAGGETYNLSSLSPDETKMVNMKLLSLYHDLVLQKITATKNEFQKELQPVLETKFDKATKIELGSGLTGSADFSGKTIQISIVAASDSDIENLFAGGIL